MALLEKIIMLMIKLAEIILKILVIFVTKVMPVFV